MPRAESIRAVADALPLLAKAEAVEVLVVDHRRHPAGHGQEPGADIGATWRVTVRTWRYERLSSGGKDVGRLLLSRRLTLSVRICCHGRLWPSQLREWMFGGVTRTVLYERTSRS